ncbi:hypothetical protein DBR18_00855 [Pseudomonas sp. HMWF021]|nr:hypothetical protein DBR18_00855 [Pseudomonas sp. HMWF021]
MPGSVQKPVGASLLAKAACQPPISSSEPAQSRAGSLLHWMTGAHKCPVLCKNPWERACSRRRRVSHQSHRLNLRNSEQAHSYIG